MEFRLDEFQVGLQETVARFCGDRFPFDSIAEREGAPSARATWTGMADLGVFSLLLPEDAGGSGLGAVEAAIVFEQLGDHLVPGPAMWTLLSATFVDGAATGEAVVGGVEASAVHDGSALVEHGAALDVVAVFADDGVTVHRTAALDAPVPLEPLDPLTPVARLSGLEGGERVADAATAATLRRLGTVLVAASLSGIAARALEVARSYALEREQFDVPIGSFQAVKHMLADMYLRAGLAQSATYAAAAVLGDPGAAGGGASDEVAAAKVVAVDAAITNAATAIQVLGGMGFTWDMLPNHLLKRAWVLEHTFGTADEHAESLGAAREGGPMSTAVDGIVVERDGGVLRIRIDRPERKGSVTMASVGRIIEALEAASTDDSLRVVVLIGTGDDFCAGSDWVATNRAGAEKPRPGSLQRRLALQAHRLIALMLEIQLPIVCSVRGWAAGLGCQLALASDFTLAADDSRFWLPFTGRGFAPDSGSTWLVPRLVGVARAKDLLLLGREVDGARAAEWGMIHASFPGDELDGEVDRLVEELAASATVAIGLTKRCIHTALDGGIVQAMADEAMAIELASRTADFREGLAAFTERRDPAFEGR